MKSIRNLLLCGVVLVASFYLVNAQETTATQDSLSSINVSLEAAPTDEQIMLQAIESVAPTPFANLSRNQQFGTFWSAQHAPGTPEAWPPLPGNMWGLPVWSLGDNVYLLDDRNLDYAALAEAVAAAQPVTASPMMRMSMMASSLSTAYAYGNPIYLGNLTKTFDGYGNLIFGFSVYGGTNFVPWDIEMTTNLAAPNWSWQGIAYTSNSYSFYADSSVGSAFYRLVNPAKTMTVGFGGDIYGQSDVPSGLTNILMTAAGYGYSLGLLNGGTVVGWGSSGAAGWVPTNLVGNVSMISAAWDHNVALLTNGTVQAWGANVFGVLNVPSGLSNVVVISAQSLHTLALCSNGTVEAWGYDSFGQCDVPYGLTNVTAIAAGGEHSLAVSGGYVVAWGDDWYGQCDVPMDLSNVWDVAASGYHSLALKGDGTVEAWGDNAYGECNVPAGLSNVVAIAAGGDYFVSDPYMGGKPRPYSLALKSDGTVVAWGAGYVPNPMQGLNNTISIAGGLYHALAIRTGPPTPVITLEPTNRFQAQGQTATFTARGAGLYGVTYQWQTNGVNLSGATNATLTLTNVQPGMDVPYYGVVVTDNGYMGSLVSSNANLYLVTAPVINSQSFPTNQTVLYQTSLSFSVSASAPGQTNGFPLSYQWQLNGTNISGATSATYTFAVGNSGMYSVIVSNAAGSATVSWQVNVVYPGGAIGWGSNSNGQINASTLLTDIISLAAGKAHGLVALDSGNVTNWGAYWTGTNFVSVSTPPTITNALAVAAGSRHDIALKANGSVIAWGLNDFGQTNVPINATNIIAISAGGQQSVALKKDGTVFQWGQTNVSVPIGLTNATAIASGTNFNLALLQNSTVVAWGANDYGQTNIPAGLSNVVAIAAGGAHALALLQNGTVIAWGAWTNVPAGLSNVLNVAAGENHNIALKNDGTVVVWGDDTFGQTNVITGLNNVKLIAGGGDFTLAVQFSTTTSYPLDVTKDLLLIYNANSTNSIALKDYYLAHRPMITGVNVLGVACDVGEFTTSTNCNTQIVAPLLNWLTNNPTKRPQYIILFYDIPTRLTDLTWYSPYSDYGSVSYHLHIFQNGWQPFVNYINAGTLNDCMAYVDKIANMATNNPGTLVVSASANNYGNTNYYFEDAQGLYSSYPFALQATQGVTSNGVPPSAVDYLSFTNTTHITRGTNVSGYLTWGANGGLGGGYPTNGAVIFTGNSSWYLIETIESFNGMRGDPGQGTFIKWLLPNAFGGTNYSNTPIGAVTHVEEPYAPNVENSQVYFGLWASGKNFGICAWNAQRTPFFQAVGDPFVTR